MVDYQKNKPITATATSSTGEEHIISKYEWSINNTILTNNETNILVINANTLPLGNNTISVRAQNDCGRWSELYSKTINIINSSIPIPNVIPMQKTITIDVNQPNMEVTVVMDYTATIKVTVTDPVGNPVTNATVYIGTITTTTNTLGVATLTNVPYGNGKTIFVTVP